MSWARSWEGRSASADVDGGLDDSKGRRLVGAGSRRLVVGVVTATVAGRSWAALAATMAITTIATEAAMTAAVRPVFTRRSDRPRSRRAPLGHSRPRTGRPCSRWSRGTASRSSWSLRPVAWLTAIRKLVRIAVCRWQASISGRGYQCDVWLPSSGRWVLRDGKPHVERYSLRDVWRSPRRAVVGSHLSKRDLLRGCP